ncbi:MAG: AAA family ATPase [Spirochaetia bacterium]|nr:AAA family ATPase [Spirochaetia bacterium]
MDLFEEGKNSISPLADAMRPETLDDFFGQEHIVGKGRLLRRAIQADQLSSLIFYGPPGTGKTTLARIIANTTSSYFISINAVLSGVKEIRDAIEEAKKRRDFYGKRTILFVDEVHRWNKAQQDALLPWVENGTFIFIGATTENPYFEVNSALVSRSRVFQLLPLTKEDLKKAALKAISNKEKGYGRFKVIIDDDALEHLASIADGDARSLLNALQLAVETTPDSFPPPEGTEIHITLEIAEESIQKKAILYDKEGDYHYDMISAFIKSLRGSDPDAALYWMARMIAGGEDPKFIFRRMMIQAAEDVGMADPYCLPVVVADAEAFDRVGMPEGQFFLSHAALYITSCKKTNTTYAYYDALDFVQKEKQYDVPSHLKDASRDKESFGHGEGYKYPHAFKDHWVAQQYLPSSLKGKVFYTPSNVGYEGEIAKELSRRREVQLEAQLDTGESTGEILTFSPDDKSKNAWFRRTAGEKNTVLSAIRDEIFADARLLRHHKVLIPGNDKGLLAWEASRRTPEGGVFVLMEKAEDLDYFINYPSVLPEVERPVALQGTLESFAREHSMLFDCIIGRNTATRADKRQVFDCIHSLLEKDGSAVLSEIIPSQCTRLSQIAAPFLKESERKKLTSLENKLYGESPLMLWNGEDLVTAAAGAGFLVHSHTRDLAERRYITQKDIDNWLNSDNPGTYGNILASEPKLCEKIKKALESLIGNDGVEWKTHHIILTLQRV